MRKTFLKAAPALTGVIVWVAPALTGVLLCGAGTQLEAQQSKAAPSSRDATKAVLVEGIQVTTLPEAQGGGKLFTLQTSAGKLGPFKTADATLDGLARSRVKPPMWAGQPCQTGQYAATDEFLYLCVGMPVGPGESATGTRWRRIRWDPEFEPEER